MNADAGRQCRFDGMAGHDYEDFCDDDDLDALPHAALIELENNAIQFTQAQTQAGRCKAAAPSSDYGDDFDDEDFDEEIVIDESRSTPAIIPPLRRNIPAQETQQKQFRQQRYGTANNSNQLPHLADRPRPTPPRFSGPNQSRPPVAAPLNDSVVAQQGSQPSAASEIQVESLQKQLEEVMYSHGAD